MLAGHRTLRGLCVNAKVAQFLAADDQNHVVRMISGVSWRQVGINHYEKTERVRFSDLGRYKQVGKLERMSRPSARSSQSKRTVGAEKALVLG